ncbi:DUF6879 family protein [Streptomyces blastmyceticus]|uniref:DUF6879 domain-containing protein n=1 Tax=Streptomyces blastmyceticus TaxID=68180 RepID=A0ABP3G0N2_9ACTN
MLLAGDAWDAKFRNFTKEAWRLETLPQYIVPQEAEEYSRFLSGQPVAPEEDDEWADLIKTHRETGGTIGRVHIVTRPLSDYIRFEFAQYYAPQSDVGEDIRILDVTDRPNPLEGVQDFWMFDRSTVVLMNYEPDGKQIDRELFDGDPASFVEYQRIALAEAVPFSEYVKQL